MELQVKRDPSGILKEVNILDVSSREWVLMRTALTKYIESEEAKLTEFQARLVKKIERSDEAEDIQSTQELIDFIEKDIEESKGMIEALTEKR